ncbi:class IV adenylate cyclase [Desulfoluna sp.]|uniref:class IV adenylate cyclase n=1 Tax=Desulfoluna sp. TaxID=2045199 RepID=UPI002604574A|nr:class IV adenylate cyclase [Desulfoluna sp.]
MKNIEVEVKYRLVHPDMVRRRLVEVGAKGFGRSFETNVRYDTANGGITQAGCLLRLRKDGKTRLTHKAPHVDCGKEGFKIHRELEVEVSDFDTMDSLLKALGFEAVQIYEKWRETFHLNGCEICLDTLPYGEFMEIEGEKAPINEVAEMLGLARHGRIVSNYLALFEALCREYDLGFSDLTFDNFVGRTEDFGRVLSRFETNG